MALRGWTDSPTRRSRAARRSTQAGALAPDEPDGYRALGQILVVGTEYDQARDALERALESIRATRMPWGYGARACSSRRDRRRDRLLQLALKFDPALDRTPFRPVGWLLSRTSPRARAPHRRARPSRFPDFPMFTSRPPRPRRNSAERSTPRVTSRSAAARLPFLDLNQLVPASTTRPTPPI